MGVCVCVCVGVCVGGVGVCVCVEGCFNHNRQWRVPK